MAGLPVVFVAGGISADRRVCADPLLPSVGWWASQAGAGKALDTARFRLLTAIVVLQTLNGWFNGMGWPPCGKSMVHWFSKHERGLTVSTWNVAHNIGGALVARAQADGYTLFMGTVGTHAINSALYKKMPFDHIKDFQPLTRVAMVPNLLVANPARPYKTVKELIAHAKANPDKVTFGSSGNGEALCARVEQAGHSMMVDTFVNLYRPGDTMSTARSDVQRPLFNRRRGCSSG